MTKAIQISKRIYKVRCQHCDQVAIGPALGLVETCVGCGKDFVLPTGRKPSKKRFCNRECFEANYESVVRAERPLADRFWAKVKKTATCWLWMGSKHPRGYGQMAFGGRSKRGSGRTMVLAHRFAWELTKGPIPEGLNACHHCDNPQCVRPSHLFLGTQSENLRDMYAKCRRTPRKSRSA